MRPKLPAGARAPVLGRQEVMEVVRAGLGEEVRLRWSKLMAEAERLMPPRNAAVIDLCVLRHLCHEHAQALSLSHH